MALNPNLESELASELKSILAGLADGATFTVEPPAGFCSGLELYIPMLLRRRYPQWEWESLDGVFVACAHKTGPDSARLGGTCILISDQTVTPFLLDLEASSADDSISCFRVSLGEPGDGALGISGPPCNSPGAKVLLASIADRIDNVSWSYETAGYQERPGSDSAL